MWSKIALTLLFFPKSQKTGRFWCTWVVLLCLAHRPIEAFLERKNVMVQFPLSPAKFWLRACHYFMFRTVVLNLFWLQSGIINRSRMQITRFFRWRPNLKKNLVSLFRWGIFRPSLGEDRKRKKSSPPIRCVIFRSILSDDKRNKKEVLVILLCRFSAEIWNWLGIIFMELVRATMIGTSYKIEFSFSQSHIVLLCLISGLMN